jgi:hypothetical protein
MHTYMCICTLSSKRLRFCTLHAHARTHTHTQTHTHTHTHTSACLAMPRHMILYTRYIRTHTRYMRTYTYIQIHTQVYIMPTYIHTCTYTQIYSMPRNINTYIYIHTYAYISYRTPSASSTCVPGLLHFKFLAIIYVITRILPCTWRRRARVGVRERNTRLVLRDHAMSLAPRHTLARTAPFLFIRLEILESKGKAGFKAPESRSSIHHLE